MAGSKFGARPFIIVAACVAVHALCGGRAVAALEFCPAVLGNMSPIGAPRGTPATMYSYELTALAPRSVQAWLIADTNAGWFGWNVEGVDLTRTTRFFRSVAGPTPPGHARPTPPLTFGYPAVASAPLSVSFPSAVTVRHAWVLGAKASDASSFGKDPSAMFSCDVPDLVSANITDPRPADVGFATPSPLPSPTTPSARAAPTSAPFPPAQCSTPFLGVKVMKPEQPDVPTEAVEESSGGVAVVQVAVGKDGKAIDAWILASSGSRAFDRSALAAARSSVYSNAVSYCRPVNGSFLFRAVFQRG